MINIAENKKFTLKPTQIIALGFFSVIILGALLLNLSIASKSGIKTNFLDSLFTSTSAVCVTGLVVVDTGTHWTTFGQVVIVSLIQIGGLGFMTLATLLSLLIGKKIGLKQRLLIQESLNQISLQGMVKFIIHVIKITLFVELIGVLLLSIQFVPQFGLKKGLFMSIFHAISAFNNAGFDIMGEYTGKFSNLTSYVSNPLITITISLLIILGGIGFFVYKDIINSRKISKLSIHSKLVFITTISLILFGALFFFIVEYYNPYTLGNLSLSGKIQAAFFQSITPRTAGFNTIPIDKLTTASKLMTVILMFIGGSPGSTAGGIKTVTLAVLILAVYSVISGREDIVVFKKKLHQNIVYKCIAIIMISLGLVTSVTMTLTFTENIDLINILLETFSAFGTVGLSAGVTPNLSVLGKILISLTMFFGRVGPLSIALALAARTNSNKNLVEYPEDRIMVG